MRKQIHEREHSKPESKIAFMQLESLKIQMEAVKQQKETLKGTIEISSPKTKVELTGYYDEMFPNSPYKPANKPQILQEELPDVSGQLKAIEEAEEPTQSSSSSSSEESSEDAPAPTRKPRQISQTAEWKGVMRNKITTCNPLDRKLRDLSNEGSRLSDFSIFTQLKGDKLNVTLTAKITEEAPETDRKTRSATKREAAEKQQYTGSAFQK